VESQRKSLIVLFAPALALVLRALFAARRGKAGVPRRYGEHLVFALHVLAFAWLALAGTYGVVSLSSPAAGGLGRSAVTVVAIALLLAIPSYVFVATRRVYALSTVAALGAAAVIVAAFMGLLFAYRGLLFFTTYYTL
jgi:hypothetical protein